MSVQQNQSFGYAFTGLLGLVNWYSVCFVVQMLAFVTEIPELKLEDFYCSLESVCLTVYSFWPLAKHFGLHKRPSAITKHLCWMFLHMQYLCADCFEKLESENDSLFSLFHFLPGVCCWDTTLEALSIESSWWSFWPCQMMLKIATMLVNKLLRKF